MPARISQPTSYARVSRSRMRGTIAFFLALLLIVAGRLFYVQVVSPETYSQQLLKQSLRKQVIPATRGEILDANGKVLAHSVKRYDIVIDQTLLINPADKSRYTSFKRRTLNSEGKSVTETVTVSDAAGQIAKILKLQKSQVERAIVGTRQYAYIFQGATGEERDKILAIGLPGLYAEEKDVRQYPMGRVGGSIVGFRNQESSLGGIELMKDGLLKGTNGERIFQIGRDGIRNPYGENELKPATNGSSVKLTIDSDLQWFAEETIADATARLNGEWGNVIVMEVATGRILASADHTSVDPNDVSKHKGTYGLQPIGIVDGFEPGSTSKVVTFAGALEQGLITPTTPITTPNRYTIDGEVFKDYEDHPEWKRTAAGVLAKSLNTGTVQVGAKMTRQERYDWLKKFGAGQKVGLGFPGEQAGILEQPEKWDARKAYTVTFGQGYTQTALHTAQIFQTIANGGVKIKPSIIDSTIAPDGTVTPAEASPQERVISEKTSKELTRMMENVTVDGSGVTGALKNYRVATKTGTAQSVGSSGIYDAYTISFAGYAPAENPKYVVVATIGRTQEITSSQSGPVFAKVMERVLTMNNVPPSTTKPDLYPTFSDGTPNEGSLTLTQ